MEENINCSLKLNSDAPRFCAESTKGLLKLTDYIGKWLVLFCHREDFSPICTTELISLGKMYPEFQKRNCEIVDISKDTMSSHMAWSKDIEQSVGIKLDFPLVSDKDSEISNLYNTDSRTVYIICPEQKIRAILTYPNNVGRNISEIIRIVDGIQATQDGSLAPANWTKGNSTITYSKDNYIELMDRIKLNNLNYMNVYDLRRW